MIPSLANSHCTGSSNAEFYWKLAHITASVKQKVVIIYVYGPLKQPTEMDWRLTRCIILYTEVRNCTT